MIDINNGCIMFNSFNLYPHMCLESLLGKLQDEDVLSRNNGKYVSLYLRPQQGGDAYFVLRLFFEGINQELKYCQISRQYDNAVPSWADWNEIKEKNRKAENDLWLTNELGNPPYNYAWGEIRSLYNSREASSYIVINYK